ncbi:MAG: hypothetical protein N2450_07770 [bacterium]|nr:hypothetical protein [bacterium]
MNSTVQPPFRLLSKPRRPQPSVYSTFVQLYERHLAQQPNDPPALDPPSLNPTPPPFFQGTTTFFQTVFSPYQHAFLQYDTHQRAAFFRYLRDRIPIVSAGIWSWVHLCATPLERVISGPEYAKPSANQILDQFEQKLEPYPGKRALERLTEALFLELFTLGRCAVEIVPYPDLSGIDRIHFLDPYRVRFGPQNEKYWLQNERYLIPVPPDRFFYAVLTHDPSNPSGIEPLATLPFVLAIETQLLEDMARSAKHAGTPRLQIKITPPPRDPSESAEDYELRASRYFDDTVQGFSRLEADDHLFTWSDVEVTVIGGDGGMRAQWRIHRQEVMEDVITGLKLFPWVLGRSHGTTKNWVEAQYNLLMHIVRSLQLRGLQLADRLANIELALRGNPCTVEHRYEPHADPFALPREQAFSLKVKTLLELEAKGYIHKEEVKDKLNRFL